MEDKYYAELANIRLGRARELVLEAEQAMNILEINEGDRAILMERL